jgi:hypothetical protein|tara:strand:- start:21 stop:305 length:285 start_codon:yes stop_codon:yes gene_type:complete
LRPTQISSEGRLGETIVVELKAKVYRTRIQAQLWGLVEVLSGMALSKVILTIQNVRYALRRALEGRGNTLVVRTFDNLVNDLKAQYANRMALPR